MDFDTTAQFRRDLRLAKRRGKDLGKFQAILDLLLIPLPLPERCRPHLLSGEYAGLLECHIESDWLLVWEPGEEVIVLVRMGAHSDIFH